MVPKTSAAVLLYRRRRHEVEVLLVHPGGPFWARKDLGAWSLPKGELTEDEPAFETAKREFREETGMAIDGQFTELKPVKQRGGKTVVAWAVEGDLDPSRLRSNTFSIEWPPKSGKIRTFPEVDRAEWFPVAEARNRILEAQADFLDQLVRLLE
jgi:predicted NUDIX family NTP pyrophosphohydrolase